MKVVVAAVLIVALVGCSSESELQTPFIPGPGQGVEGMVVFWEGDFMPLIPENQSQGRLIPVERTLAVFEAANFDDVVGSPSNGGFYSEVHTRLVAMTTSDEEGRYDLSLAPGTYSVFVLENGYYYANGSDGEAIQPVTVERDRISTLNIDITYEATF
ncbi:carboxypeptidase-like regulatory domain-containing protein [bacterium]|nr:carboxypeptidase-like regulatory domain-containing protein [bacterium]